MLVSKTKGKKNMSLHHLPSILLTLVMEHLLEVPLELVLE